MSNVVQIGTVRMLVQSVGTGRGGRTEMKAYCKMNDAKAPFVSTTVTVVVPIDCHLAYKAGDEFDLLFPLTAISS